MSNLAWCENWERTKQRFDRWWNHQGLLVSVWFSSGVKRQPPYADVADPGPPRDPRQKFSDIEYRVARNHHARATDLSIIDQLPVADTNVGPGSLAMFIGSEPGFEPETVWFNPRPDNPEEWGELKFDPENKWWQHTERFLRASVEKAEGNYLVGCPDLVENIDVLASIRDAQTLLMDMIENPSWVSEKVREINQVWFEAYRRIYDIIKDEDGSSSFSAFMLWGRGKVAKLQCDAAAMFSPEMFGQFVVPSLTEQCAWLDNSMFHLDGTQCICHLDQLLAIDELDAVEWTPQAGLEGGGDPRWYQLYHRILDAGKSLQAVGVKPDEIVPLLDEIGGKGVYIIASFESKQQAEEIEKRVEQFTERP